MAGSEFWRNLAKEFRALPTMGTEFRADRCLSTTDQMVPQGATWLISCSNRSLERQWEPLAKRGGNALSENDIVDAVYVWLETLRAEKVNTTGLYFAQ
jgi:hypothetical protein